MSGTKLGRLIILLAGLAALCIAYGYFIEPHRLVAAHSSIRIENWPEEFDGFKIVMISDIHGGSNGVTSEKLKKIVDLTNEQDADLVVMLGDYVSQRDREVRGGELRMAVSEIADGLSGIRSRNGILCVLGNHDGIYGDELIVPELERIGCRVLENEVASIDRNGRSLRFLGLKDHMKLPDGWSRTAPMVRDLIATTGSGDVVILQHSPDTLHTISGPQFGVGRELRLFLAGHTHGGQVWLPILGTPAIPSSYGQEYARGHAVVNGVDMFVTSGVGESLLPFRFMVPPEIAVLTIHRKD